MKYIIVIILALTSSLTNAQDNFLAYRVTGPVTFRDKNKEAPLKVGKVLDQTARVKIGKGARLLLICGNSSATIELMEGTHVLSKLANSCNSPQHSLTANYFNYVWWQLTHPKASIEEERKMNRSGSGAVSRGCLGIEFRDPDTVGFFNENVVLKWKINVPFKTREFVLYAYSDSPVPLLKIPLKSESLHLNSLKDKLEPSTQYFWTLSLDGKESCPRKMLQVWSADDIAFLTDSVRNGQLTVLNQAERDYMMGWIFEQNHLRGEALRYYKLAAASAPGNDRYKRTIKRLRS